MSTGLENAQRNSRVIELFEAELSYSKIALELDISRSTVAGIVKRWKDEQARRPAKVVWITPKPRKKLADMPIPTVAPTGHETTLLALKLNQCAYPNESGYYCGAETVPNKSFCPHHMRICFVPASPISEGAIKMMTKSGRIFI